VSKLETLRAAYEIAKKHNGAPGIDGVALEAIEEAGVERFLGELRDALVTRTYWPLLKIVPPPLDSRIFFNRRDFGRILPPPAWRDPCH